MRALEAHRVEVRFEAAPGTSSVIRRLDPDGGALTMSREVPDSRQLFQLAHTLGLRVLGGEDGAICCGGSSCANCSGAGSP